jgi:hypothetical protein
MAYIDESWDQMRATKAKLEKNVPPLQKRAQETHRILLGLLNQEKLSLASVKAA